MTTDKTKLNPADEMMKRARELHADGLEYLRAVNQANIERQVEAWPSEWENNLQILIYGDFKPPEKDIKVPELGITVYAEKQDNTVVSLGQTLCVLKAYVSVNEKTVLALSEAAERINVFLGLWTLVSWGNAGCGWWSHLTHPGSGGALMELDNKSFPSALKGYKDLPNKVQRKVSAAIYWVRAPKSTFGAFPESDTLQLYAGYWNAFECLVGAVNILKPRQKMTPNNKQQAIDQFLSERNGKLTAEDISECYSNIVNPGFKDKAKHALQVCFQDKADCYIEKCFGRDNKSDRLYDIRNGINHGDINSEDPLELARIETRMGELWMIVLGMFGRILPFPVPIDRES